MMLMLCSKTNTHRSRLFSVKASGRHLLAEECCSLQVLLKFVLLASWAGCAVVPMSKHHLV